MSDTAPTYLPGLYCTQLELIVIFLCPEYAAKRWCQLEWRHIRQLIATADDGRIMFLSFGNPDDLTSLGILGGDGYIDILRLTPQETTEKIIKRLRLNQGVTSSTSTSEKTSRGAFDLSRILKYAPADLAAAEALINACGYHRREGELADAKRAIRSEQSGEPANGG